MVCPARRWLAAAVWALRFLQRTTKSQPRIDKALTGGAWVILPYAAAHPKVAATTTGAGVGIWREYDDTYDADAYKDRWRHQRNHDKGVIAVVSIVEPQ